MKFLEVALIMYAIERQRGDRVGEKENRTFGLYAQIFDLQNAVRFDIS